jgi:transcriptional regulator with GAF, ATPase, and Fis domain
MIERGVVLASGSVLEIPADQLGGHNARPTTQQSYTTQPSRAAVPAPAVEEPDQSATPTWAPPSSMTRGKGAALVDMERNHILSVLAQTNGTVEGPRGAAVILGLHPNTLRSRMKKLGLR